MTPRTRLLVNVLLVLALIGAGGVAVLGWHALPTAAPWGRVLIGVGSGGVIGIGSMFFLPLELRANLTLMGGAILLTLWVASWIVYATEPSPWELRQREFAAAARAAGAPFDMRTRGEVIRELRSNGVDATPALSAWALLGQHWETERSATDSVPQADARPDLLPLAGRSRTTTVACNEQGDFMIIESDRYGFNNPDHVYASSSPVLILGDSYAFGYCVRPHYDVGSQLRARGVDVVNLGYPGTGPLIQLAQLREYGRIVQPSVILWLYYHGNDGEDLTDEYRAPALRRYLDSGHHQDLAGRQPKIDAFWADYYIERAVERAAALDDPSPLLPLGHILLLRPIWERLVGQTPATRSRSRSKATGEEFEETLDAMIAEAEALDATLYFVFLPSYDQFAGQDRNRREEARGEVLSAVRARGLPIIDFQTLLIETGDPLDYFPFRLYGHYTEAGYALLADQLLDRLR